MLVSPTNNALLTNYKPKLDWNNATAAQHYQVQVSKSSSFGTLVVNKTSVLTSEYTLTTSLAANTTWYWRVRTYNSIGQVSAWSTVWHFRTAIAPPTLMLPANGAHTARKPLFDWNDPAGATGYTLQISKFANFSTLVGTYNPTVSKYTPTANLPTGTLYWRVRAKGANGPSGWSSVRNLKIP